MSLQFYVPISKVDKERRMVWGYASTPSLDLQGERVDIKAIKAALPDYMAWGNIREMHQPSAVGVAKEANVDDKGLFVGSKIVDDDAWKKCLEGVYKGYSIGGERISKQGDTITELKLLEISLVDRPANPDCRIEVAKAAGPLTAEDKAAAPIAVEAVAAPVEKTTAVEGEPVFTKQEVGFLGRIMSKLSAPFAKTGAAHDGFSLPAAAEWRPDPLDPAGGAHAENARPLGQDGGHGGDTTVAPAGRSDDGGPGLVELMDEKKDADSFSDKERDKLAEHGLAMRGGAEHGSYPIRNRADLERAIHAFGRAKNKAKVRAWIIHRAHELKATDLLPPDWPGSTKEEKTTLAASLQKGLIESWCPGSNMTRLAAIYDELISLSRSLRWEADQEVGDKKDYEQANKVSVLAQAVGTLLAEHAAEEVQEEKEREAARKSLSSAGITLETVNMTKSIFEGTGAAGAGGGGGAGGDSEIAKRASEIGKVVHDHLTKAREHDVKAHKALMRSHEHFDAACKCMGKSEGDAALREHLGHAHAALAEHFEHHMARGHHLHEAEKAAAGWVGERSLAPGAAESVYKPEEGLTALAQRHMTEGSVPDYPSDRPYRAGAAPSVDVNAVVKDAVQQSVQPLLKQVETLTSQLNEANVAKAKAEGRAEAFAAMPAGSPRPRLFAVDKGAFAGAGGSKPSDQEITMEGVDVDAASTDPDQLLKAAARMHGNKVFATITGRRNFGKSITDASFAGGGGR